MIQAGTTACRNHSFENAYVRSARTALNVTAFPKFVAAATLPEVLCQRSHASCYQAEVNNVFAARTERTGRDTITARQCDPDAGFSSS